MVFSGYTSSSGIAGSYSSSIFTFLRNRHTVLHHGCINLRSHQQRKRFLVPPHPLQHLLFEDFVMIAILTDVRRRWYLIVWKVIVAQWYRIHLLMQEKQIWSLGQEEPLEKQMATHSGILAWKFPWTEKSGRLQPMGSQRVGHDRATSLSQSSRLFCSLSKGFIFLCVHNWINSPWGFYSFLNSVASLLCMPWATFI